MLTRIKQRVDESATQTYQLLNFTVLYSFTRKQFHRFSIMLIKMKVPRWKLDCSA